MLLCKQLHPDAILPTCAHPGEDLAFDLYALEETKLDSWPTIVRTGISAKFINNHQFGLLLRDRSSMAAFGLTISGGVIDSGYAGEILVMLSDHSRIDFDITWNPYIIKKGDKIAQMIPVEVNTNTIIKWADELPESDRKEAGFGSTGK